MPVTEVGVARLRRRGRRRERGHRIGAPLSLAYLVALTGTALAARAIGTERAHRMKANASTDVAHLEAAPGRALIASAFVLDGRWELGQLALVAAALLPLERRIGSLRTAAVFAGGHVGATLATELPIALAISRRQLPESSAHRIDVGPSFGAFAALGVGCGLLPGALRPWALLGLAAGQSVIDITNRDPAAAVGHAVAIAVGVSTWPFMSPAR